MPDERKYYTRRKVLAGTLGAGMVASAGCLTAMPSLGQQIRFGRVDEPTSGPPIYRDWIPAEGTDSEFGLSSLVFIQPGSLGIESVGHGATLWSTIIKQQLDYVGMDFESFDYVLAYDDFVVARGDIDWSAVESTIARTSYERAGEYETLTLYRRDDTNRTLGIGDDVMVGGRGDTAQAAIERVYDTGRGTRTRRHETDQEFATVTERVGASPSLSLGTGPMLPYDDSPDHPDSEWSTMEYRFDDEYVYLITTLVYPEGESVPTRHLEETVYESDHAVSATNVDIRADGRFGVIVIQLTHSEIRAMNDRPDGYHEPFITWGIKDDGDTLTLVHETGDTVDASWLSVEIDGEPTDEQFGDEFDTVGPGDRLGIDVGEFADDFRLAMYISLEGTNDLWIEFEYTRD